MLENPNIITLDTKAMMIQCQPFCEELCKYVFSPQRFKMYLTLYNYNIGTDEMWEDM